MGMRKDYVGEHQEGTGDVSAPAKYDDSYGKYRKAMHYSVY